MAIVTGYLALSLLLLLLLPPLRLLWLEKLFGGLPPIFRIHHMLAYAALFAMMGHAFIAMFPYLSLATNFRELLGLFFDPADMSLLTASLGLLSLSLVVASSLLRQLPRKLWLSLHRFSILGFILVVVHVALIWQRAWPVSSTMALIVRFVYAGAALMMFVLLSLHFFYPELLATRRRFVVKKKRLIAEDIHEIALQLGVGGGLWQGGDFGFFRFDCEGSCGVSQERHPFTVLKVTKNDELHIVVKAVGDDTRSLQNIELETKGEVSGPYGVFPLLLSQAKAQIWIAGGLGILPFLGLLHRQKALHSQMKPQVGLVYLYRRQAAAWFQEELERLALGCSGLQVVCLQQESNQWQEVWPEIVTHWPDWQEREFAIAGPHPMVGQWTAALRTFGIPYSHIYTEDYLP